MSESLTGAPVVGVAEVLALAAVFAAGVAVFELVVSGVELQAETASRSAASRASLFM
jgi:hypothetical protein